jgi:hypothetical protein
MKNVFESVIDSYWYEMNESLVKKFNRIKKFINDDTFVENGCLNQRIKRIYYEVDFNEVSKDESIVIETSTFKHTYKIQASNGIKIDSKYNCLVLKNV